MITTCFYNRLLTNFKCCYFCKVFSKKLHFILAFCISVLLGYVFTSVFVNLIVCINGSIPKRGTTWFDSIVAYHNVKEPTDKLTYLKEPLIENELEKKRSENVRVLCWIMTCPDNHESKAYRVKETWGRRCNILLFMSTDKDAGLDTVKLNVSEGRSTLWGKTRQAFNFIYNNYFNEADWFMKADDDTYFIMENLRYMLAEYNSSEPVYFGSRFRPYVKQGYMSGGAGYVLSKEALKLVVTKGFTDEKGCQQSVSGTEDVEMGVCLENVGVKAMDTRDSFGRSRFFPYIPEYLFVPGHLIFHHWYWRYAYYPQGSECCSNTAISFHYASGDLMSLLERILYENLRPYGMDHIANWLPQQILESKEVIIGEKDFMCKQIDNLQPIKIEEVEITFTMQLTMINGKALSALTGTSTLQCPLCKQTEKGSSSWTKSKPVDEAALEFGISPLHAYIRFFEFILALSYRLGVKTKSRGDKNMPEIQDRKERVLLNIKEMMYLNPDRPKQGFGSTTDGNSARRFFTDPKTASNATGLDEEIGLVQYYLCFQVETILTWIILKITAPKL